MVGCKTNMLKQCIIVGYLGGSLSLDDDRSVGRVDGMEWFGEVGLGMGMGIGRGRGEGKGRGRVAVPF